MAQPCRVKEFRFLPPGPAQYTEADKYRQRATLLHLMAGVKGKGRKVGSVAPTVVAAPQGSQAGSPTKVLDVTRSADADLTTSTVEPPKYHGGHTASYLRDETKRDTIDSSKSKPDQHHPQRNNPKQLQTAIDDLANEVFRGPTFKGKSLRPQSAPTNRRPVSAGLSRSSNSKSTTIAATASSNSSASKTSPEQQGDPLGTPIGGSSSNNKGKRTGPFDPRGGMYEHAVDAVRGGGGESRFDKRSSPNRNSSNKAVPYAYYTNVANNRIWDGSRGSIIRLASAKSSLKGNNSQDSGDVQSKVGPVSIGGVASFSPPGADTEGGEVVFTAAQHQQLGLGEGLRMLLSLYPEESAGATPPVALHTLRQVMHKDKVSSHMTSERELSSVLRQQQSDQETKQRHSSGKGGGGSSGQPPRRPQSAKMTRELAKERFLASHVQLEGKDAMAWVGPGLQVKGSGAVGSVIEPESDELEDEYVYVSQTERQSTLTHADSSTLKSRLGPGGKVRPQSASAAGRVASKTNSIPSGTAPMTPNSASSSSRRPLSAGSARPQIGVPVQQWQLQSTDSIPKVDPNDLSSIADISAISRAAAATPLLRPSSAGSRRTGTDGTTTVTGGEGRTRAAITTASMTPKGTKSAYIADRSRYSNTVQPIAGKAVQKNFTNPPAELRAGGGFYMAASRTKLRSRVPVYGGSKNY